MPTKTELEDQVLALTAELEEAKLEAANAKDAYQTAVAEHEEALLALEADHDVELAHLAANCAAEIAKKAAAATPASEPLGSIHLDTGVLILGDATLFDQKWKRPQDTRSAYVVDIEGPHAERLAHRQKHLKCEALCDGKWRIHVPTGHIGAANLRDQAEKLISQQGWDDKVTYAPIQGFTQRAIDGARAHGAGLVQHEGQSAYLGVQAAQALVSVVRDAAGNAAEIHIKVK